ncbi:DUF2848 domain-containing protein [Bordetella genomosp. 1]|uniref:DUF2848 domain-containing protein n=1 Tax=Bordetella genomosp. 1 TaxID=1395607 RepID=A0ABX4EVM1_9BORD|nr:DUF2848 domain-containing protein [Bordetella genomosp. 1]OZI58521.1 hypothetical protein CAL27_17660 [Bordetella genomosp. 1]
MKVSFQVQGADARVIDVEIDQLVVAGWAGRDRDAIEHHIEELAALGVPRPSTVPLYYRIAENQLTQAASVQALGEDSSGEAETFVFKSGGELYVSLASDHTDRKLESVSVAFSKQACIKPVAREAWRHAEVAGHWDELVLRAYIVEGGKEVVYQDGPLATLQNPLDLIKGYAGDAGLAEGTGMTCGTVAAIGGIRPSTTFIMELHDPVLGRSLRHRYDVTTLPVVA